jgi:hypothetical protein
MNDTSYPELEQELDDDQRNDIKYQIAIVKEQGQSLPTNHKIVTRREGNRKESRINES